MTATAGPETAQGQLVALITGCSEPSSIGAHLALDLKRRGYKVYASARMLETLATLQGGGCEALALDVTDKRSIEAARKYIEDEEGRLDVLVNNAGVAHDAPILDTDLDRMRDMYEVNVYGPLAMVQAFAPLLVRGHKTSGRPSVVVNVGSVAAHGTPWLVAYGSSKAALQSLSDGMRRELGPLGIAVVTVELSSVKTAMTINMKPFPLASSSPSGFYANYAAIHKPYQAEVNKRRDKGPAVDSVARSLGDAIAATTPPPKVWLGAQGLVWRGVIPLLPIRTLDNVLAKACKIDMVQKP